MKIPPMFFSVLSVKFTGRVKFGAMQLKTSSPNTKKPGKSPGKSPDHSDTRKLSEPGPNVERKIPTYKVITPEHMRTFGEHPGEYLSYQSMALLLRTLHPEVSCSCRSSSSSSFLTAEATAVLCLNRLTGWNGNFISYVYQVFIDNIILTLIHCCYEKPYTNGPRQNKVLMIVIYFSGVIHGVS